MTRALQILPLNEKAKKLYTDHQFFHEGDSGLDLFITETKTIKPGETAFVPLGIKAAAFDQDGVNVSFLILPRSSIVKTPLRLANNVGLIDAGYRGELVACFDNIKNLEYTVESGQRLVQALYFDGKPFSFKIVDSLTETTRGEGGWGSTGTSNQSTMSDLNSIRL